MKYTTVLKVGNTWVIKINEKKEKKRNNNAVTHRKIQPP